MPINHKSVVALITSAILLVAAAVALYIYSNLLSTTVVKAERKNHAEVRVAVTLVKSAE